MAPVNTAPADMTIKSAFSGCMAVASGIASGINMPIVPYDVPVAKEMMAPSKKTTVGNKEGGNVFPKRDTR